jgi:hypothetical protein
MALVLFAIQFLFGARGMERRRAISFSLITGLLLLCWDLPVIIEYVAPSGTAHLLVGLAVSSVTAFLMPLLYYVGGRCTRGLVKLATNRAL